MGENYSECGSGKFASWSIPPEMIHEELQVSTSAQQQSITPATGKKIRLHTLFVSCNIGNALTATVRCSVSFGTGGITVPSKVLVSQLHSKGDSSFALWSPQLNVIGAVNETVTLTNTTFSAGDINLRAVVYYTEE